MEEIRICAFIDVLGTKEIMMNLNDSRKTQLVELIRSLSSRNTTYNSNAQNFGGAIIAKPTAQSTSFSDNVAISIPIKTMKVAGEIGNNPADFSIDKSSFFQSLLFQIIPAVWDGLKIGVLLRGGITMGTLTHDDQVITGEALITAIELEKNTKWPRIEISSEIFSRHFENSTPIVNKNTKDYYVNEIDNRYFINALNYPLGYWTDEVIFHLRDETKKEIITSLSKIKKTLLTEYDQVRKSDNEEVISKWDWFFSDLERAFKTGLWSKIPGAYEAMF